MSFGSSCGSFAKRYADDEQRRGDRQGDVYHSLSHVSNDRRGEHERERVFLRRLERHYKRAAGESEVGCQTHDAEVEQVVDVLVVRGVGGAVAEAVVELVKEGREGVEEGVGTGAEQLLEEVEAAERLYRFVPHKAAVSAPAIRKAQGALKLAQFSFGIEDRKVDDHAQAEQHGKSEQHGKRYRHRLREARDLSGTGDEIQRGGYYSHDSYSDKGAV